jgi:hypothetical protein
MDGRDKLPLDFVGIGHRPQAAAFNEPPDMAVKEAIGQNTAVKKGAQFALHKPGHQTAALPLLRQEGFEMAGHNAVEHTLFRPARAVLAGGFMDGEGSGVKYKIVPQVVLLGLGNGCRIWADHSLCSAFCGTGAAV